MKIRSDFVTNSSSSSFVIAKRTECTFQELRDGLEKLRDKARYVLEEMKEMYPEEYADITPDAFLDSLAQKLIEMETPMSLGDWNTTASYFSNEGDIIDVFMYENGHLVQTENFKVGGRYE